jgi:quinoprotein glucose dehydrogenase
MKAKLLGAMLTYLVSASTGHVLAASTPTAQSGWSYYGGDPGDTRYSPLAQITPANVKELKQAWVFHTGDVSRGSNGESRVKSGFEATPLMLDGRLFLTTGFNRIIALDPTNGNELWSYDPKIDRELPYGDGLINRGLAMWRDPLARVTDCSVRLFEATLDARLIAVDAATGNPCEAFGIHGQVSLADVKNYHAGWYHMTSPPTVLDDVVIVGSAISDNIRAQMPDGVVRGFDTRTGKLLWSWEPLVRPAGVAPSAWKTGAGNAWSILTADPQRHLVYVPTRSASPDYYGGLRPGDDRWADSVVALQARTGKLIWGFQLVHHDLWDYDTAASPLLTSLRLHDRLTPVLIAGNKTGMLYVLDPATGKPLLPVEERPVPQSTVPGERTSPTQPFPITIPPLAPQSLEPTAAWGRTDDDRRACAATLQGLSGHSIFSPPSLQGTVSVPGPVGGINWSGYAWDAEHQRLIVAVTNFAYEVRLIPSKQDAEGELEEFRAELGPQLGTPYTVARGPLRAPSGLPCTPPPWGELMAVDLAAGKVVWHQPLGRMTEPFPSMAQDLTGSAILGGPIVTASGLIFIGGTMDRRLRALSADTGQVLWSVELPASAHAMPMTYEANGKQYIVIAAGGHWYISEERRSDALIAYALP